MSDKEDLLTILVKGTSVEEEVEDMEVMVDDTIRLLSNAALEKPEVLFRAISEVVEVRIDGMVSLALAVLMANAEESWLESNSQNIVTLLHFYKYNPLDLLQLVEYLKSKYFGRGFGSRPQKWIREVMESLQTNDLKEVYSNDAKSFVDLIRLVHPRYHGAAGNFVKSIL